MMTTANYKTIYLDNSATTAISASAQKAWLDAAERFGNPSSRHFMGTDAKKLLEESRQIIITAAGISHIGGSRLVFTSCGSEGNNFAIRSALFSKKLRFRPRVIVSDAEHPSVYNTLDDARAVFSRFGSDEPEIIRIPTEKGVLDADRLFASVNDQTVLVCLMQVNNETGAKNDIAGIFGRVKAINPSVLTHTDAVQGFLKAPCRYDKLFADTVSFSGHKVHAPKGIGALYISERLIREKRVLPVIAGGGQEFGLRSGTENTPLAAAFAAAVKDADPRAFAGHAAFLRARLEKALPSSVRINTPAGDHAAEIISLTLPRIKSETALTYLSTRGICVSSGSACASNGRHKSHVLRAFGLSDDEIDSTIRVSVSDGNTESDMDALALALENAIAELETF